MIRPYAGRSRRQSWLPRGSASAGALPGRVNLGDVGLGGAGRRGGGVGGAARRVVGPGRAGRRENTRRGQQDRRENPSLRAHAAAFAARMSRDPSPRSPVDREERPPVPGSVTHVPTGYYSDRSAHGPPADVAQLVERDLPKVDVASSSLVIRSVSNWPRGARLSGAAVGVASFDSSAQSFLLRSVAPRRDGRAGPGGCDRAPGVRWLRRDEVRHGPSRNPATGKVPVTGFRDRRCAPSSTSERAAPSSTSERAAPSSTSDRPAT